MESWGQQYISYCRMAQLCHGKKTWMPATGSDDLLDQKAIFCPQILISLKICMYICIMQYNGNPRITGLWKYLLNFHWTDVVAVPPREKYVGKMREGLNRDVFAENLANVCQITSVLSVIRANTSELGLSNTQRHHTDGIKTLKRYRTNR